MRLIILTGMSGAGKTTALRCFEDIGYYAVDNLPPRLLADLAESCQREGRDRALAVVDSRVGAAFCDLTAALGELEQAGITAELIYLDAADEVLVSRFKETRRPHPVFRAGNGTILAAIHTEREMLSAALERADRLIDTSAMTPAELRARLTDALGETRGPGLIITVESFGFKHGAPIDADLVFDVRFLANPHYVPDLKPFTGSAPEVAAYVHADPLTAPFLDKLFGFIDFTLPQYLREGKAYLNIAIGCTGGRHRSVLVAEELAAHLHLEGYRAVVYHRDVERESGTPEECL